MKHRPARIVALLSVLCVGLAVSYKVFSARWSIQSAQEAHQVIQRAALALELKIEDFSGPEAIDSGFFGSNTYEWERRVGSRAVERLVYDPFEQHVCWSKQDYGTWKHHGCITAKSAGRS